jgi:predicted phage baseplate assembly protein
MTGATKIVARYRAGNGRQGNVGAEALAHIAMLAPLSNMTIQGVRNPLPAQDGTDPEAIEQVRQYAPAAFQAVQYRAVTEADYMAAALTVDGVAAAVAQFRWTGSWYTAYVGIDPSDPANVVTLPDGRTALAPVFATAVTEALEAFQLAGYDLEVRSAQYVPLLIEVHLCVSEDHFQADVVAAVLLALDNGVEPDGRLGFFNPANFAFGQPVYLSRLYAAIDAVEGVDSAQVTVFQRYGRQPQGELQSGVIPMGPWEIARLDNDINLMENGVLIINADGGK